MALTKRLNLFSDLTLFLSASNKPSNNNEITIKIKNISRLLRIKEREMITIAKTRLNKPKNKLPFICDNPESIKI